MTARAETIMAALETALTGLTTTGTNIQRGQIYRHEAGRLPAIALFMGADEPLADYQTGLIDWDLSIRVEATVKIDAAYTNYAPTLETSLNAIREEVHIALLADHTLGLAYVIDVIPGAADAPILQGEGDEPTASQSIEYVIRYRTSRTDIGA